MSDSCQYPKCKNKADSTISAGDAKYQVCMQHRMRWYDFRQRFMKASQTERRNMIAIERMSA